MEMRNVLCIFFICVFPIISGLPLDITSNISTTTETGPEIVTTTQSTVMAETHTFPVPEAVNVVEQLRSCVINEDCHCINSLPLCHDHKCFCMFSNRPIKALDHEEILATQPPENL